MVAFTFSRPCGWDGLEKPGDLLVCGICLPIEYRDWYADSLEGIGRQSGCDRAANDSCQHFWIRSRYARRYEVRRGEVSGNDFPLLQYPCTLLRPYSNGKRTRYRLRNRPIFWKLQDGFFDGVVADPGENSRLHLRWAQHEQSCDIASSH
jgi:hypothetical protein